MLRSNAWADFWREVRSEFPGKYQENRCAGEDLELRRNFVNKLSARFATVVHMLLTRFVHDKRRENASNTQCGANRFHKMSTGFQNRIHF